MSTEQHETSSINGDSNVVLDQELIDALVGELDDATEALRSTADDMLKNGTYEQSLNSVFRCVHSIKSNLRMVFLDDLADYTHEFENLLSSIREGLIEAPPAFFPMVLLVMTEISELAKTSITGGHIDEPFMVLLSAVDKLKVDNTTALADSAIYIMSALEPEDNSGYIARLCA